MGEMREMREQGEQFLLSLIPIIPLDHLTLRLTCPCAGLRKQFEEFVNVCESSLGLIQGN